MNPRRSLGTIVLTALLFLGWGPDARVMADVGDFWFAAWPDDYYVGWPYTIYQARGFKLDLTSTYSYARFSGIPDGTDIVIATLTASKNNSSPDSVMVNAVFYLYVQAVDFDGVVSRARFRCYLNGPLTMTSSGVLRSGLTLQLLSTNWIYDGYYDFFPPLSTSANSPVVAFTNPGNMAGTFTIRVSLRGHEENRGRPSGPSPTPQAMPSPPAPGH
jgi:hypothetical protein